MLNGYLGLYFKMNNSLPVNLLVTKNTSFKSFLSFFKFLEIGYSGPRCVELVQSIQEVQDLLVQFANYNQIGNKLLVETTL